MAKIPLLRQEQWITLYKMLLPIQSHTTSIGIKVVDYLDNLIEG